MLLSTHTSHTECVNYYHNRIIQGFLFLKKKKERRQIACMITVIILRCIISLILKVKIHSFKAMHRHEAMVNNIADFRSVFVRKKKVQQNTTIVRPETFLKKKNKKENRNLFSTV